MVSYTTLIIEDFEVFRKFVRSTLQRREEFQVIYQASDGLEGVQRAKELQPDLILIDIGLPKLNGIEAARRIRKVSPNSKILFLTQESSAEVVEVAMSLGAQGYALKVNAADELLPAVETILRGEQFISRDLEFNGTTNNPHRHEILFCSDDTMREDGLARFVGAALNAGNPAIVWATKSHREGIRQRLNGQGVDVDGAIQRGTYISSDASEPPDRDHIVGVLKGLSEAACKMGKKHPRVAVCGERAGIFWERGKTDDALRLEQLFNELAHSHDIDILCVYPLPQSRGDDKFKKLCAKHTTVCYLLAAESS